jgi:hypothetical protein
MSERNRPGNRNPDPVISLNRQFNKLMQGKSTSGIKDKPVNGWVQLGGDAPPSWTNRKYHLVENRYNAGDMIYRMQVDYCYLIKQVSDTQGKNTALIKACQEFINNCRERLANV